MQIDHVAGNRQRLLAAAALKWLDNAKPIRQLTGDGGHVTRRAGPAV
jgi:hypothetical protein